MVQEYVSPVRVHKYPFEMVMAAYERRFPTCPQIPVVEACLVTADSWTEDNSQRHTTRRCQLNVDAPYLLKKMIGVDYIFFIQKNHLDLKNRFLEIEATNETFSSRVSVLEKCKYFVHPENPEWTCFEQSAVLDVKNFFGLENTVEKLAMKQYGANIAKGKELIESFMKGVYEDNITELAPWRQGDAEHNAYLRNVVSRGAEPISPSSSTEIRKQSSSEEFPLDMRKAVPDESYNPQCPSQMKVAAKPSRHLLSGTNMTRIRESLSTSKSLVRIQKNKALSPSTSRNLSTRNIRQNLPSSSKRVNPPISRPDIKYKRKQDPCSSNDEYHKLTSLAESIDDQQLLRRRPPQEDRRLPDADPKKPCHCESNIIVLRMFARADSTVLMLAVAVALLLLLTAPLTLLSQWWS